MLIQLEASDSSLKNADQNLLQHTLGEVLRAHRRGHHFALIGRATASWLLRNLELAASERTTLEKISQQFAQFGNLGTSVGLRMIVDVEKVTSASWQGTDLIVGLSEFRDNPICEVPSLLCEESVSDGRFYNLLFEIIVRKDIGLPIKFDLRHGGGDQIPNILQGLLDDRRIVISIVDSDKKHPNDQVSAKIVSIRSITEGHEWRGVRNYTLPCHEIENLLCLDIISSLPLASQKHYIIAALKKIADKEEEGRVPYEERFHLYYDFKNGASSADNEWIESKKSMGGAIEYLGFGNNIISQALSSRSLPRDIIRLISSNSWREVFLQPLTLAAAFGIAAPRSIT